MCSIGGIFDNNGLNSKVVLYLNQSVKHRGPDDEGYTIFNRRHVVCCAGDDTTKQNGGDVSYFPNQHVSDYNLKEFKFALCQRRLSIVDLTSNGHQPMSYDNGQLWIAFNGEIYNYKELRDILYGKGFQFKTSSDTEVILAAYQFWGEACVNYLHGMWAFVICDLKKSKLFISRDRFGIKPFYYTKTGSTFTFGSEIKQLLSNHESIGESETIFSYLSVGIKDYSQKTMYKGILQLEAGSNMTVEISNDFQINTESIKISKWYKLQNEGYKNISFSEATERFKELFYDSVSKHFVSEVNIGSCLSGGLDSSSIVAAVSGLMNSGRFGGEQLSFSARSQNAEIDEGKWMQKVYDAYPNIKPNYVYPDETELLEILPKITWHQDEPFQSTSVFAQWKVFELAKQNNIKVMIDGQGSDEYLCGYDKFIAPFLIETYSKVGFKALLEEVDSLRDNRGISSLVAMKYVINNVLPHSLKNRLRKALNYSSLKPTWMETDFCNTNAQKIDSDIFNSFNSVESISENLLFKTNLPLLLHCEDRNSMAHSIEARVPFLDHKLVEFGYNLPIEFKIKDGFSKYVLRKSMDGVIPNQIAFRKDKVGFATAEKIWVKEVLKKSFIETIREGVESQDGIINKQILVLFDEFLKGKNNYQPFFFRVYNYYQWKKIFNIK